MKIHGRPLGPMQANCYILADPEAGTALVIDPGDDDPWLAETLGDLRVSRILLTHAHCDHIGGLDALRRRTGAPVYMHRAEAAWLGDPDLNLSAFIAGPEGIRTDPPEGLLDQGDRFEFNGREIRVLHTPGHSPGGIALLLADICFSGDTLFYRSVGRGDLPGGRMDVLLDSIREHLLTLPEETRVLPGHGPATTVGDERRFNPFLQQ